MNNSDETGVDLIRVTDSDTFLHETNLTCLLNRDRTTFGSIRISFAVLGFLVNALFIVTMIKNSSLRNPLMLITLMSAGDLILSIFIFNLGVNELIGDDLYVMNSLSCFYLRPHLSFLICGLLLQSVSICLVAIQRMVAVVKPLLYYKNLDEKFLLGVCIAVCSFVLLIYFVAIGVAAGAGAKPICSNQCWPTVVSGYFSGFLYAVSACLGLVSIACYLLIFVFKLGQRYRLRRESYDVDNGDRFGISFHHRETWLMQICCILTFTAMFCVVLPHCILLAGMGVVRPTSFVWYLRRYVSFMLGANTFLGMTISFAASRDLRFAVKTTLLCKPPRSPVDSIRSKSSSLGNDRSSVSKITIATDIVPAQVELAV